MDTDTANRQKWETTAGLKRCVRSFDLREPEKAVIRLLREKLPAMRMLDIGIGAGRTTRHFVPLVNEYVGIDYSRTMIEECEQTFADAPTNVRFVVCDASDMEMFVDASFDLLFFSHNGIDALSREKRQKVFAESLRVGRSGGFFYFSTHNLRDLKRLCTVAPHRNPLRMLQRVRRSLLMRRANSLHERLLEQDDALVTEPMYNPAFVHFYVKPQVQLQRLRDLGFQSIRAFGYHDGRTLDDEDLRTCTDKCVAFLCGIP